MKNAYSSLVEKLEGKIQLGISRNKWEDNIKVHHKEIRCQVVDWICLAQDRFQWSILENAVIKIPFS
jgi:hypothetical protein